MTTCYLTKASVDLFYNAAQELGRPWPPEKVHYCLPEKNPSDAEARLCAKLVHSKFLHMSHNPSHTSPWFNYFWGTGPFTKTWQLACHFQWHYVWNKRFTKLKRYKGEDKWVRHWNYYTNAYSNWLQIPTSGMPLVEASLTLSFFDQYQC